MEKPNRMSRQDVRVRQITAECGEIPRIATKFYTKITLQNSNSNCIGGRKSALL